MLCVENSWVGGNDKKYNYRKDLLKNIDYAKKLQKKGYFVSYNLDDLKAIIKESATPKEALSKMTEKLGFHPTVKYDYFSDCSFEIPIDIYLEWYNVEDSPILTRRYLLEEEMQW